MVDNTLTKATTSVSMVACSLKCLAQGESCLAFYFRADLGSCKLLNKLTSSQDVRDVLFLRLSGKNICRALRVFAFVIAGIQ